MDIKQIALGLADALEAQLESRYYNVDTMLSLIEWKDLYYHEELKLIEELREELNKKYA